MSGYGRRGFRVRLILEDVDGRATYRRKCFFYINTFRDKLVRNVCQRIWSCFYMKTCQTGDELALSMEEFVFPPQETSLVFSENDTITVRVVGEHSCLDDPPPSGGAASRAAAASRTGAASSGAVPINESDAVLTEAPTTMEVSVALLLQRLRGGAADTPEDSALAEKKRLLQVAELLAAESGSSDASTDDEDIDGATDTAALLQRLASKAGVKRLTQKLEDQRTPPPPPPRSRHGISGCTLTELSRELRRRYEDSQRTALPDERNGEATVADAIRRLDDGGGERSTVGTGAEMREEGEIVETTGLRCVEGSQVVGGRRNSIQSSGFDQTMECEDGELLEETSGESSRLSASECVSSSQISTVVATVSSSGQSLEVGEKKAKKSKKKRKEGKDDSIGEERENNAEGQTEEAYNPDEKKSKKKQKRRKEDSLSEDRKENVETEKTGEASVQDEQSSETISKAARHADDGSGSCPISEDVKPKRNKKNKTTVPSEKVLDPQPPASGNAGAANTNRDQNDGFAVPLPPASKKTAPPVKRTRVASESSESGSSSEDESKTSTRETSEASNPEQSDVTTPDATEKKKKRSRSRRKRSKKRRTPELPPAPAPPPSNPLRMMATKSGDYAARHGLPKAEIERYKRAGSVPIGWQTRPKNRRMKFDDEGNLIPVDGGESEREESADVEGRQRGRSNVRQSWGTEEYRGRNQHRYLASVRTDHSVNTQAKCEETVDGHGRKISQNSNHVVQMDSKPNDEENRSPGENNQESPVTVQNSADFKRESTANQGRTRVGWAKFSKSPNRWCWGNGAEHKNDETQEVRAQNKEKPEENNTSSNDDFKQRIRSLAHSDGVDTNPHRSSTWNSSHHQKHLRFNTGDWHDSRPYYRHGQFGGRADAYHRVPPPAERWDAENEISGGGGFAAAASGARSQPAMLIPRQVPRQLVVAPRRSAVMAERRAELAKKSAVAVGESTVSVETSVEKERAGTEHLESSCAGQSRGVGDAGPSSDQQSQLPIEPPGSSPSNFAGTSQRVEHPPTATETPQHNPVEHLPKAMEISQANPVEHAPQPVEISHANSTTVAKTRILSANTGTDLRSLLSQRPKAPVMLKVTREVRRVPVAPGRNASSECGRGEVSSNPAAVVGSDAVNSAASDSLAERGANPASLPVVSSVPGPGASAEDQRSCFVRCQSAQTYLTSIHPGNALREHVHQSRTEEEPVTRASQPRVSPVICRDVGQNTTLTLASDIVGLRVDSCSGEVTSEPEATFLSAQSSQQEEMAALTQADPPPTEGGSGSSSDTALQASQHPPGIRQISPVRYPEDEHDADSESDSNSYCERLIPVHRDVYTNRSFILRAPASCDDFGDDSAEYLDEHLHNGATGEAFGAAAASQQRADVTCDSIDNCNVQNIVGQSRRLERQRARARATREECGDERSGRAAVKDDKFYAQFPLMKERPRPRDIIAFKCLELDESYSPHVSDYREAAILEISDAGVISLELIGYRPTARRRGRFELFCDDDDEIVDLDEEAGRVEKTWTELIEPRLLHP